MWLLDPLLAQSRLHFQHPRLAPAGYSFSSDSKTLAIGWNDTLIGPTASNAEVWLYHSYVGEGSGSGAVGRTGSATESSR